MIEVAFPFAKSKGGTRWVITREVQIHLQNLPPKSCNIEMPQNEKIPGKWQDKDLRSKKDPGFEENVTWLIKETGIDVRDLIVVRPAILADSRVLYMQLPICTGVT